MSPILSYPKEISNGFNILSCSSSANKIKAIRCTVCNIKVPNGGSSIQGKESKIGNIPETVADICTLLSRV